MQQEHVPYTDKFTSGLPVFNYLLFSGLLSAVFGPSGSGNVLCTWEQAGEGNR